MKNSKLFMFIIVAVSIFFDISEWGATPGHAQRQGPSAVIWVRRAQFKPAAGTITFSEVPIGTVNPVYPPRRYGGGPDSPTVKFAGHFLGRRIASPEKCPPGAVVTGCLDGTPVNPLQLDLNSPPVFVVAGAHNRIILAAVEPKYNGPVAIWFDRDVAAVGLDGGWFDAAKGTAITVYDRTGKMLGRRVNEHTGVEFMGLAMRDVSAAIAGLEFHIVGEEPEGFGVDNIRFAFPEQIDLPAPPVPPPPPPPPPPPEPRRPPILP